MAIKEVRIAHVNPQGGFLVIKESLGPVVRKITMDERWNGFVIHKYSAVDGSLKPTMLLLNNAVWVEFDVENQKSDS